tara:strand:- start:30481 stop:32469 length:1989 start_codon:yes stop_codon:yes gene_type:complete
MSQNKIDILERALAREKSARKQAEKILEDKSAELYRISQKLYKSNLELEKAIYEKNSELKGVFENIVDAYVVMNLENVIIKMNDAAIDLLGYDSNNEDVNLSELVHFGEKENVDKAYSELVSKGILTRFELKIVTKSNQEKTVQINASIIYNEQNRPIAAQGIIRDVTEEKKAEQLLIASENRLSSLILNLDTALLLEDENQKIVLTNTKFCDLFSIPLDPEDLVGVDRSKSAEESKTLFEDSESFVSRIKELTFAKKMVLGDTLVMKNGKILERDYIPVFENRYYKGNMWSYKEVTLQEKFNQSIEAEKQKYSSIIANMNLGLLEVDLKDKILMANQSFLEMSGYSENELLGNIASDIFVSGENKKNILKETSNRIIGKSNSYELQVNRADGKERFWLISGAPNYNINAEVIGSIGIHLDITEFKNLEKQQEILLNKLEKSNTELEEYAHIVSHDLKSPLRSINALVSWLKEDNQGKFDMISLRNFDLIEKTLEKMEKLISDILEYSSINTESDKMENVDINEVVENLHHVLFIPNHIELKIKNKLPVLKGDTTRFQQLFLNIVSNAVRYIDKEKGLVEVDVNEFPSYYQFSIKDNGIGIEKKDFNKIFKIFQALTDNKESSGIGLSIVKKIINLYKGEIWLESELGIGTTFYFTISRQKL